MRRSLIAKNYAAHTWQRIEMIKQLLTSYRASIKRLNNFATGRRTLRKKGYTTIASCTIQTPDDKARMRRTVQNLEQQIQFLKYELTILQKYGA